MTGNDSDTPDVDAVAERTDSQTPADSELNATPDGDAADRIAELEATIDELTMQLAQLERNVTWMARQQAAETGNGVCPYCNKGGALVADRTPTGKTQVRCTNCEQDIN